MGSQVSPWLLWKPPMEATRGSRQWKPPSPVVGVGVSVRLSHHSNHLLLGLPLGRIATATKQATPAAVAPVTAQRRVGLQRPSTRGRLCTGTQNSWSHCWSSECVLDVVHFQICTDSCTLWQQTSVSWQRFGQRTLIQSPCHCSMQGMQNMRDKSLHALHDYYKTCRTCFKP